MKPMLPHTPPMLWLDDVSDEGTMCTIAANHPFVRDGQLLPGALIEILAQAAAAEHARSSARRIRRGYLAAIREFRVLEPVPAGSSLILSMRHEKSLGSLTSAQLTAHIGEVLVAEGRMTFHLEFE